MLIRVLPAARMMRMMLQKLGEIIAIFLQVLVLIHFLLKSKSLFMLFNDLTTILLIWHIYYCWNPICVKNGFCIDWR